MKKIMILGIIGQWMGLIVSTTGIALLVIHAAPIWTVFISAGSIAWGIGTKLKYYTSINLAKEYRGERISLDELLSKHNITPYRDTTGKTERRI